MTMFSIRPLLGAGLLGAVLMISLLCPAPAAAQAQTSATRALARPQPVKKTASAPKKTKPATEKAQPDSLISIHFADPAVPDIRVTGVATAEPYGIHYSKEELRARDQAALAAPPPEPSVYEIYWQSHEDVDVERLRGAFQAGTSWSGYGWANNGWSDYGTYVYPFTAGAPATVPGSGYDFHLTPPEAYPRFNLLEYNAALADWRRAQERAALRGATPRR